jgi:hypothetical protein
VVSNCLSSFGFITALIVPIYASQADEVKTLQLAQAAQPPKEAVQQGPQGGGTGSGAYSQPSKEEVQRPMEAATGAAATRRPAPFMSGVSACSLCYTCGGNWPAFSGVIPLQAGVQPWERDSACSGNLTPRADSYPYLCCQQ